MTELYIVMGFFLFAIVMYIVSAILLCVWLGKKIATYRYFRQFEMKGIGDWICLTFTAFNFYLIVPLGILYALFLPRPRS